MLFQVCLQQLQFLLVPLQTLVRFYHFRRRFDNSSQFTHFLSATKAPSLIELSFFSSPIRLYSPRSSRQSASRLFTIFNFSPCIVRISLRPQVKQLHHRSIRLQFLQLVHQFYVFSASSLSLMFPLTHQRLLPKYNRVFLLRFFHFQLGAASTPVSTRRLRSIVRTTASNLSAISVPRLRCLLERPRNSSL